MKIHPTRRARATARNGFSLLELILAMSVVVMLSAALYASLSIAVRAKRSAEAAVRPARVGSVVGELVAQDLEAALPPNGVFAGTFTGTQQAGLEGDSRADTIDFYCVGEDLPPAGRTDVTAEGVRRVQLALRTDVTPPVLVRRIERNLLSNVARDPEEEVLCRGVRSFGARYFDGSGWYETWDSTTRDNTLPTAVELTLVVQRDVNVPTDVYTVVRVVPLSCGVPATEAGGTQ